MLFLLISFLRLFWNLMSCVTNRISETYCADVFNTFIAPLINAFTKDFFCFPRHPIDIETHQIHFICFMDNIFYNLEIINTLCSCFFGTNEIKVTFKITSKSRISFSQWTIYSVLYISANFLFWQRPLNTLLCIFEN